MNYIKCALIQCDNNQFVTIIFNEIKKPCTIIETNNIKKDELNILCELNRELMKINDKNEAIKMFLNKFDYTFTFLWSCLCDETEEDTRGPYGHNKPLETLVNIENYLDWKFYNANLRWGEGADYYETFATKWIYYRCILNKEDNIPDFVINSLDNSNTCNILHVLTEAFINNRRHELTFSQCDKNKTMLPFLANEIEKQVLIHPEYKHSSDICGRKPIDYIIREHLELLDDEDIKRVVSLLSV